MSEINWLKSLPSPPRAVPQIDVTRSVMAAIPQTARPDRAATLVWSLAAALGLTASTAAGLFAFSLLESANDPAQAVANAWSTVFQ